MPKPKSYNAKSLVELCVDCVLVTVFKKTDKTEEESQLGLCLSRQFDTLRKFLFL